MKEVIEKFQRGLSKKMYERKSEIMVKYKEEIYGVPPDIKDGRLVPGTGRAPDTELIDTLSRMHSVI